MTLRARGMAVPPLAGILMAAPKGRTVWRVLSVTKVQTAGKPDRDRYRLVCERVTKVGEGASVQPWAAAPPAPRAGRRYPAGPRVSADPGPAEPAGMRLGRIRAKAPLLLTLAIAAIREGRIAGELAQVARATHVGRDDGVRDGRDYGPGIGLRTVWRGGIELRPPMAEIQNGPDPAKPNQTVSRARRVDPLVRLHAAGTITGRHIDAAEMLREQLEASEAGLSGGGQSEIHVPPHQRLGQNDRQLDSRKLSREAVEAIGADNRPVVIWTVCGGTIAGFASHWHIRHVTASARLKAGLTELARHYRLPGGEREPGHETVAA